jgi:hypothetical protein
MSNEPPTLQAVLDALREFHSCYEFYPGDIGPGQLPPGKEAGACWLKAHDLMIARGVHPGSLKEQAIKLSELDLANVENRLAASRSSPNYNERNHCDVPGHVLQRMIDYIRATGGTKP